MQSVALEILAYLLLYLLRYFVANASKSDKIVCYEIVLLGAGMSSSWRPLTIYLEALTKSTSN